jgi:sulfatase maturation enzyme AslB (radical SAM superfamily)
MSCSFCFVDRTAPDFDVEQLQREIEQMARGGTRHLVLSGGEPTLHPGLADLFRFAKSLDAFDVIEMQSNGVKCADMEYARELVEAGLNKVTFSLHSIDPEHSDAITRLPKAFGKTIQAIHNFRELGILTQIAHVLTKANYQELPGTVRYLRREFPADGGHLSICLAIAQGISDLVFEWVIPTFTEIKPFVSDALDFCLETDVGFGGMIGQGGYPPCMLDGEMRYYEGVLDKVFKSADSGDQFYKPDKCKECSFDPYCLGPRRSYVEHYGDAEIKPFRAQIDPPQRQSAESADYSAEAALRVVAESTTPRRQASGSSESSSRVLK